MRSVHMTTQAPLVHRFPSAILSAGVVARTGT